jgi:hypothetical protein
MLSELFPRGYPRYASLPVLGECLDGFVVWLRGQGYPLLPIRLRIRATPRLDDLLCRCGVRRPSEISSAAAPLSAPTVAHHSRTVAEFIAFLDHDHHPDRLRQLDQAKIEDFLLVLGARLARASLQHSVAHLRSFLRFLADQALVRPGLDSQLDAPRLYRGERLPRALSWETVRARLSAIDRSTPTGRRNYAMLLLVATYGLRSSEVVAFDARRCRMANGPPPVSAAQGQCLTGKSFIWHGNQLAGRRRFPCHMKLLPVYHRRRFADPPIGVILAPEDLPPPKPPPLPPSGVRERAG